MIDGLQQQEEISRKEQEIEREREDYEQESHGELCQKWRLKQSEMYNQTDVSNGEQEHQKPVDVYFC